MWRWRNSRSIPRRRLRRPRVCDIVLEPGAGKRLKLISDDPYRLPYEANSIDFVCSDQVLEHVQDHHSAFREIARVLRPGAISLHFYPPKWRVIEVHVFVPFASVIHVRPWLRLWAALGVRNEFQVGKSVAERVELNRRFLIENTNYLSRNRLLDIARSSFLEARYVEEVHLAGKGKPTALARPYSGLRMRMLFTRARE